MNKTVLKPIEVPNNEFCWDGKIVCQYFESEGGHPSCDQGFYIEELHVKCPHPKPKECLNLKNAKPWSEDDFDYTP